METEGNSKQSEENLVKKTCKELGITQKELAEKLGVSQTTVMRWGQKTPDKITETLMEGLVYKKRFQEIKNLLDLKLL